MPLLRHLAVLFAFLAAFVRPAPASALAPATSETRVGGFEVAAQLLAGELGAASREQHQGIGRAYDENASGYRFAAGGIDDAARFIVSPRGTAVEKAIADRWARGTFGNVVDSIEYHFAKHGAGRTLQQYTDDAVRFFQQNKGQAQWGKWNPNWEPSYRLKIGNQGGYFTADGRVLTYWD